MAEFLCRLGTESGRVVDETFQAASEEELRARLSGQGYLILKVRPHRTLTERVGGGKGKIGRDDFVIFNQQFVTLSKSGLPLQKSLDLLARQATNAEMRVAIENVRDRVSAGAMLSEAFEATGKFPKIYCATVKAGERSGSLDKVLSQFLAYQKTRRTFSKKFLSALIYPAFLTVFLVALITFVTAYVIPKFSSLYSALDVPLPTLTLVVMKFGEDAKQIFLGLTIAAITFFVVLRSARRSRAARMIWERTKLRLPIVGKLLLKFAVAEFARNMGTLLQGGTPIVPALTTARDSVSNPLIAEAVEKVRKEVMAGKPLSASLKATGLFPDLALDMVQVGETTGALAAMLESVADFYEEDVNIDLGTLVALVDPIVLVAIAAVVGFVLIAFYLPLFSLAGQAH